MLTRRRVPFVEVELSAGAPTLPTAPGRAVDVSDAVDVTAARLADAVAEYDAALDRGVAMLVLVRLDQEVAAATRSHRAALVAAAREVAADQ